MGNAVVSEVHENSTHPKSAVALDHTHAVPEAAESTYNSLRTRISALERERLEVMASMDREIIDLQKSVAAMQEQDS